MKNPAVRTLIGITVLMVLAVTIVLAITFYLQGPARYAVLAVLAVVNVVIWTRRRRRSRKVGETLEIHEQRGKE